MDTCDICVEYYTPTLNKKIICIYCDFACCKTCFKRYVSDEAHPMQCMQCHVEFSRTEIMRFLGSTYMTKEYKTYRENVVYERQKALMPATQAELETILIAENMLKQIERKQRQLEVQTVVSMAVVERLKQSPEITTIKEAFERYGKLQKIHTRYIDQRTGEIRTMTSEWRKISGSNKPQVLTYVKQCPGDDCNALLSLENVTDAGNMVCTVCRIECCKDCRECVTQSEEHTCDPNILETVNMLAKDTKPCPSCGVPIHKIEGCFAKNTLIPLFDGIVDLVQNIKIGDELIGIDGRPRTVLEICSGVDQLYTVVQSTAAQYTVNSKHKLCLVDEELNAEVRISIDTYMSLTDDQKKKLKGYKITNGVKTTHDIYVRTDERGMYYGFLLDGDHKFLFTDNTVMSNCDQMYCTSCHTAFSWRTLRIDNGRIHNPHHFEYLRRNGGVAPARDPLDVVCGQELSHHNARELMRRLQRISDKVPSPNKKEYRDNCEVLLDFIRYAIHSRHVLIPKYRTNRANAASKDLRIKLLRGTIDVAEFKIQIQRLDKRTEKNKELLDIVSMLDRCITDIVYRLIDKEDIKKPELTISKFVRELRGLETYSNECLEDIRKAYGGMRLTTHLLMM